MKEEIMKKKTGRSLLKLVIIVIIGIVFSGCLHNALPPVPEPITGETALAILDSATLFYDSARSRGNDAYTAIELLVQWLGSQSEIKSARVGSNPLFAEFEFRDGTLGLFFGGETWSESGTQFTIQAILDENFVFPMYNVPGLQKALIFDPFPEIFDRTPTVVGNELMEIGYSITHLKRDQANLESIRNIGKYGVILVITHGGLRDGKVVFLTGEKLTSDNWQAYEKLRREQKVGVAGHSTQLLSATRGTKWWFVLPAYFESEDVQPCQNALFYAHACDSLSNDTMAEALFKKGVAAYCGWIGPRNIILDMKVPQRFFKALRDGKSINEADANDGSIYATYVGDGTLTLIPKEPVKHGRVAFFSMRDGNAEIYVMAADGSNPVNITRHPADDWDPSWSPDGTKIVFQSWRDGNAEIYVMNADGTNVRNLTNNPAEDSHPDWSPDGKKIVFCSNRDNPGGPVDIYVMDVDGSNPVNLTRSPESVDWYPAWSPDGRKIAFCSNRDGHYEIYVMNADGSDLRRLTWSSGSCQPTWSPDGTKIAFCRDVWLSPFCVARYIFVMDANGANLHQVTSGDCGQDDRDPCWFPGDKIAFASNRTGNYEIYSINSDGTGLQQLTFDPANDYHPAWSP
jgi:TolB protein